MNQQSDTPSGATDWRARAREALTAIAQSPGTLPAFERSVSDVEHALAAAYTEGQQQERLTVAAQQATITRLYRTLEIVVPPLEVLHAAELGNALSPEVRDAIAKAVKQLRAEAALTPPAGTREGQA